MIDASKKYRTLDGRAVRILATDLEGEFPVAVAIMGVNGNEFVMALRENGRRWVEGDSDHDIIEVGLYEDLKIGAPVMAKNHNGRGWVRRHFAGVTELGNPLVFENGRSQWTSAGKVIVYDEVRCPTASDTSDIGA